MIKEGQTIRAYGHTLEILDTHFQTDDGEGVLCLDKDILTNMAFSENNYNDYSKSDVRKYCDSLAKELKEKGVGLKPVSINLTADDGMGWDKEPCKTDGVFLLTADMYRKYRRYISNKDDWWWISTAYSFCFHNKGEARVVRSDGTIGLSKANFTLYGVSPAYVFTHIDLIKMTECYALMKKTYRLDKTEIIGIFKDLNLAKDAMIKETINERSIFRNILGVSIYELRTNDESSIYLMEREYKNIDDIKENYIISKHYIENCPIEY